MNKELKTLKDFEEDCSQQEACLITDLRQEAIKWCRHIQKISDDFRSQGQDALAVYKWIQKFFNLTEEDLKHEN